MGRAPAPSLFGIDTGTFDSVHAHFVEDFSSAKSLGARWLHFTGDSLHWISGQLNWGTMDYEITQARDRGMGVMISLGGSPSACSIVPAPAGITRCPPTTSADLRAYRQFLRAEVLRYRNVVTYYESWVEPNHTGRWPSGVSPSQYANLLKTQYSVFQSVNRDYGLHLKLLFAGPADFSIAPGSAGGMPVLPFTHAVLNDLHGQKAFDGIALHAYVFPPNNDPSTEFWVDVHGIPYAPGSGGPYPAQGCVGSSPSITWCRMTWSQELSAYEQDFVNHGYRKQPLWLSEFGWPGNAQVPANPQPSAAYYPSLTEQAQSLRQAYQDILGLPFVKAAFVFNLRDYEPGLPNPDPPFFAHYGLLNYNRSPKPAASVFTQLARANPGR
jgi:hypothetical protein